MNPLHKAVDDYLELRRALGFKLREMALANHSTDVAGHSRQETGVRLPSPSSGL
jgi:hypothetical protein